MHQYPLDNPQANYLFVGQSTINRKFLLDNPQLKKVNNLWTSLIFKTFRPNNNLLTNFGHKKRQFRLPCLNVHYFITQQKLLRYLFSKK